ncbi:MAG TPA: DUF5985 family protein [Stellaceae bacterium]|nr:DUF5985 family protein [Stellaceae bacterium]
MLNFLSGMVTMGYLVAGVFFLKFWVRSREFLFVSFAAAFWLLAANQALLTLASVPREEQSWIFLLRLAAFTCIALAIVHKNTRRKFRSDSKP